jgi:hypothetical protein
VTITAVEAIDAKSLCDLEGPDGKAGRSSQGSKNLVNVMGDQVAITYTEALAISVEPAKKK